MYYAHQPTVFQMVIISGDDIMQCVASHGGAVVNMQISYLHYYTDMMSMRRRRTPAASGHEEQIVILASGQASSMHYTANPIR